MFNVILTWSLSDKSFFFQVLDYDHADMPGWEALGPLAEFLVDLNRDITELSAGDSEEMERLCAKLHEIDRYSKKSPNIHLSRKSSGSAPSLKAAER